MRFFDQFALTIAKPCIAFAAAGGDAPTRSMQAKRVTGAVGDHRRLATHVHWDMVARAIGQYTVLKGFVMTGLNRGSIADLFAIMVLLRCDRGTGAEIVGKFAALS